MCVYIRVHVYDKQLKLHFTDFCISIDFAISMASSFCDTQVQDQL